VSCCVSSSARSFGDLSTQHKLPVSNLLTRFGTPNKHNDPRATSKQRTLTVRSTRATRAPSKRSHPKNGLKWPSALGEPSSTCARFTGHELSSGRSAWVRRRGVFASSPCKFSVVLTGGCFSACASHTVAFGHADPVERALASVRTQTDRSCGRPPRRNTAAPASTRAPTEARAPTCRRLGGHRARDEDREAKGYLCEPSQAQDSCQRTTRPSVRQPFPPTSLGTRARHTLRTAYMCTADHHAITAKRTALAIPFGLTISLSLHPSLARAHIARLHTNAHTRCHTRHTLTREQTHTHTRAHCLVLAARIQFPASALNNNELKTIGTTTPGHYGYAEHSHAPSSMPHDAHCLHPRLDSL
jgi:hypothetical protein